MSQHLGDIRVPNFQLEVSLAFNALPRRKLEMPPFQVECTAQILHYSSVNVTLLIETELHLDEVPFPFCESHLYSKVA